MSGLEMRRSAALVVDLIFLVWERRNLYGRTRGRSGRGNRDPNAVGTYDGKCQSGRGIKIHWLGGGTGGERYICVVSVGGWMGVV